MSYLGPKGQDLRTLLKKHDAFPSEDVMAKVLAKEKDRIADRRLREVLETERKAKSRVICGAKTRAGHPCKMKSEPGRRRCKFHGGKSTGPKTSEGRARIAAAQRDRWARHRVAKFTNEHE